MFNTSSWSKFLSSLYRQWNHNSLLFIRFIKTYLDFISTKELFILCKLKKIGEIENKWRNMVNWQKNGCPKYTIPNQLGH